MQRSMKLVKAAMGSLCGLMAVALLGSNTASAATMPLSANVSVVTGNSVATPAGSTFRIVGNSSGTQYNGVFLFQLPTLDPNMAFSNASFKIYAQRNSSPTINGDLYGLAYRTDTNVVSADSYYYVGASDPSTSATLIQDSFLTPTISSGYNYRSTSEDGGSALTDYLNAQYNAAKAAGKLDNAYIVLRLNPDASISSGIHYYEANSLAATSNLTTLSYSTTLVPEPASGMFLLAGSGIILFRRRSGLRRRRV